MSLFRIKANEETKACESGAGQFGAAVMSGLTCKHASQVPAANSDLDGANDPVP